MPALKSTKTEENLKAAFAGESQANRRYLYFAQKADVEGYNDVSAVFRSTAEGETGHAHGHLEYLEEVGDPATGKKTDPRSFCIQKTLQAIRHSDDVEFQLMFAGHNAYRFASDPFYANGYIPSVKDLVERLQTGN